MVKVMLDKKWDAIDYQTNFKYVSDYASTIIDLLSPRQGEFVLDLGCGDGSATIKLKHFGCNVLGIDKSKEMIAEAQKKGLNAVCLDAEHMQFYNKFDTVFSNAALHWMLNPDLIIHNVSQALKLKGRFVAEFGANGNVQKIVNATTKILKRHCARNEEIIFPWYFPKQEDYKRKLEESGFQVDYIETIERPTPINCTMDDWLSTFLDQLFSRFRGSEKTIKNEICNLLEKDLLNNHKQWVIDHVRLRFSATLSR